MPEITEMKLPVTAPDGTVENLRFMRIQLTPQEAKALYDKHLEETKDMPESPGLLVPPELAEELKQWLHTADYGTKKSSNNE